MIQVAIRCASRSSNKRLTAAGDEDVPIVCVHACVFVSPAVSSSQAVNWSWLEQGRKKKRDKSSEFKAQRGQVAARVAESLREMIVIWRNQMQCVRACMSLLNI